MSAHVASGLVNSSSVRHGRRKLGIYSLDVTVKTEGPSTCIYAMGSKRSQSGGIYVASQGGIYVASQGGIYVASQEVYM